MIKIERTSVMNFENAVRGMRNPMNSWEKSDSYTTHIENPETLNTAPFQFFMGENDLGLAKRLVKAGSDHRKFLRQIFVSVDLTAPRFWWTEFDTYRVGAEKNSCSTMHTIHRKPFEREDFSVDYVCRVQQNRVPIIVEDEEWRETEYDGVWVSNTGRVKQSERDITRRDGVILHIPEREIAVTEDDYLRVKIHTNNGIRSCKLHRLMAKAFIPNPKKHTVVNHKDGNKLNCNLDNLEWCTSSHNRQHACDNGMLFWSKESRDACGKRSRKLSDAQVEKVKDLRNQGNSLSNIAEDVGCAVSTISRILNEKTYVESRDTLDLIIDNLNTLRELYLETNDQEYWRQIIELLPQSYNQLRTCTLSYEVLINMYFARRTHKLLEWHTFCDWIEGLPYMKEFIAVLESKKEGMSA